MVVLAMLAAGCSLGTAPPTESVSALFPDAAGLVSGAPVQVSGVNVGRVTGLSLAGSRARVTMSIPVAARVPADVTAEIRDTTLLGEQVVDLVPGTTSPGAPLLADGATVARTEVVPGIEDLVQAGANVVGAVSANQLALLIHEGAQGLGGQGPDLHALLANLDTVVSGYASRTRAISSIVGGVDRLTATLAPDAQANAQAVTNLARTTQVLQDQSGRLLDLLGRLRDLSVQGSSILTAYLPQIDRQLAALRSVTQAVANRQQDLGRLLHYLPLHDRATVGAVRDDFLQLVNDFIVCGIPGGGEQPGSPLNSCHPPKAGP